MEVATRSVPRWFARALVLVLAVVILPRLSSGAANADVITISSYDIVDSPESGSGSWAHTYSGTFTPTGTDPVQGATLGTYTGGSGTLNDGIVSSSIADTHLFFTGTRAHPEITLRLAKPVLIDSIEIYGGNIDANVIPGWLTAATITIGTETLSVTTEPFGDLNGAGEPFNDRITLTGTPLASIATDVVHLADFDASRFGIDQFSTTEILVNGRPAVDPVTVGVDILPRDSKNTVSSRGGGFIQVAIMSSTTFNAAMQVDRSSLTFGPTGEELSLKSCKSLAT